MRGFIKRLFFVIAIPLLPFACIIAGLIWIVTGKGSMDDPIEWFLDFYDVL